MVERSPVSNEFTFRPWTRFILLVWTATEVITMLMNGKRRAIHDFIAGTVIVRTNLEEPLEDRSLES